MIQDNRPRPFGLPFFDTALLALFLLLRRAHRLVMITHHKSQKRAGLPCVYSTHTHTHTDTEVTRCVSTRTAAAPLSDTFLSVRFIRLEKQTYKFQMTARKHMYYV